MAIANPRAPRPLESVVGSVEMVDFVPVVDPANESCPDDDPLSADEPTGVIEGRDATLIRIAVRRSRSGAFDPEEAEQEAWLVSLAGNLLDGVGRDQEELPARVIVIIRNHLSDLERRSRRRRTRPLSAEDADLLMGREEDPAQIYERERVRLLVREVLEEARSRISESSHRIILLRGIQGQSYEEIARLVQIPVARVRDRYRRAILGLKDLFIERFADFDTATPTWNQREVRS